MCWVLHAQTTSSLAWTPRCLSLAGATPRWRDSLSFYCNAQNEFHHAQPLNPFSLLSSLTQSQKIIIVINAYPRTEKWYTAISTDLLCWSLFNVRRLGSAFLTNLLSKSLFTTTFISQRWRFSLSTKAWISESHPSQQIYTLRTKSTTYLRLSHTQATPFSLRPLTIMCSVQAASGLMDKQHSNHRSNTSC